MKHGWEYKKFTDVCDVQYGFAFDSKFFTDDENVVVEINESALETFRTLINNLKVIGSVIETDPKL